MKTSIRKKGIVISMTALALAVSGSLIADVPVPLSEGETITVAGTTDAAPASCTAGSPVSCPTLRSAVAYANTNSNGATHYDIIQLTAGTYALTVAGTNEDAAADGDLDVLEALNIIGAGVAATTVDGGGEAGTLQERIFTIHGAAVAIEELTMTNGYARHELGGAIFNDEASDLALTNCAITNSTATWDFDFGDPFVSGDGTEEFQGSGGAIYSKDVLMIDNCVFTGNVADNRVDTGEDDPDHPGEPLIAKVGNGGAINASQYTVVNNSTFGSNVAIDSDSNVAINGGALFQTGGNPLVVTNSTFSYNDAVSGGGINVVSPATSTGLSITNTTISGNHVTDSGAGIETNAAMMLLNVTIANNVKDSNNKGSGLNTGPSVSITAKNVLFDNNLHDDLSESSNCGAKSPGDATVISQGGNVSSDDSCLLNLALGDKENATINLMALADNNTDLPGTTYTHALPEPPVISDALDAGTNTGCPNNDQRGSIRPFDGSLLYTAICDSGAYELYVERADLHFENMTAPSQVVVGDDVTIDIVIDNGDATTADATGVVLTTNLPSELSFVSATAGCVETSGMVECSIGDLAGNTEASVTIVATADTAKTGVVVGSSVYAATPTDPNPSNNIASVTFDIVDEIDLSLTAASADPASLGIGATSTVTITVLNRGPSTATGVQLSGVIPSLVSFVQGMGCSETGGVITCAIDDLAADASANVMFEVKAEASGTADVTASVTADQLDNDPSDNSGTVSIAIAVPGGDSGGLCSYNPNGRFDPVLPALILIALTYLGYRKYRQAATSK